MVQVTNWSFAFQKFLRLKCPEVSDPLPLSPRIKVSWHLDIHSTQ